MSWLADVAGIGQIDREKRTPDARVLLSEHARLFLQGGGAVSPEVWEELDDEERAALVTAREALELDRALLLAAAVRGDTVELARRLGGERARTRAILVQEACHE